MYLLPSLIIIIGLFKVTMDFTKNYPADPPICKFEPVIFHPNVFNNGGICLSLLKKPENNYLGGLSNCWSASLSLKQLAMAIQELLHNPSTTHAAQVYYYYYYYYHCYHYYRYHYHQIKSERSFRYA